MRMEWELENKKKTARVEENKFIVTCLVDVEFHVINGNKWM